MNTRIQAVRTFLWRLVRWTMADAGLGALCAALFGMIFGGFETLITGDSSQIIVTAAYFSLAGLIAGAVLGSCGASLEGIEAEDFTGGLSRAPHGRIDNSRL